MKPATRRRGLRVWSGGRAPAADAAGGAPSPGREGAESPAQPPSERSGDRGAAGPSPRASRESWHPVARLPEEWQEWLQTLGEPRYRASQAFRWVHREGVTSPSDMTNLSRSLRAKLEEAGLHPPATLEQSLLSEDGTRKLLIRLSDGLRVECVLIPWQRDEGEEEDDEAPGEDAQRVPVTLCVSTQVGCAMGCVFCASGQAGLKRGLGAHEIVAQVLLAKTALGEGQRLRNLVFMGMGEPLHHYAQTARALRLLTHPEGLAMSPRRITVSTVGLIPGIRKLGEDFKGKIGLAISLHAPDTLTRSRILPMNDRFPLPDLLQALHEYPLPKRRRITIEYTLIAGVNDSPEQARQLAHSLRGLPSKVNLIPMNPVAGSDLGRPSAETVLAFREALSARHVSCSVRATRGDDVDAACGQLALGGGA